MFRKTPHSLPRAQYGDAGKRLFIGLVSGSCVLLCVFILAAWLVPYVGLAAIHPSLPWVLGGLSALLMAALSWMTLGLIYHVYTGRHLPGLQRIRGFSVRIMFPLMELLGRALSIPREKIRLSFVKVNNEMVLASGIKPKAHEVLLLLPHCIQRSQCPFRLSTNLERCERCGLCPIGALLALRDRWGFQMAIATGGTIARRIVVQTRPRLILAVACERDLTSGIQDTYPLPVYGVLNARPHGPCLDTQVNTEHLEAALQKFVAAPAGISAGSSKVGSTP